MTEYKCGNCREVHLLARGARFCPSCGSTSLILVIKELTEAAQKETLGVYTPPNWAAPNFDASNVGTEELTRKEKPRRRANSRQ